MARPQQPELARSAKTDLDPNHVETGLQGQRAPGTGGETGPIPPDNQPGHHPEKEQDKPDLDAFAARLGTDPTAPTATAARKPPRPRETPAKAATGTPAKADGGARKAPAAPRKAPAATRKTTPPKTAPTPGKFPASAPTPEAVGMSSPPPAPAATPEPNGGRAHEPRLVGLVLLPLRETVKRLEQLDRALTDRLSSRGR
jgi:hypothetical protein